MENEKEILQLLNKALDDREKQQKQAQQESEFKKLQEEFKKLQDENQKLKEKQMTSRLVLQVHDELLIEAYLEEVEEVKEILAYEMEHAASLLVPLDVDMHVGENWYEAK